METPPTPLFGRNNRTQSTTFTVLVLLALALVLAIRIGHLPTHDKPSNPRGVLSSRLAEPISEDDFKTLISLNTEAELFVAGMHLQHAPLHGASSANAVFSGRRTEPAIGNSGAAVAIARRILLTRYLHDMPLLAPTAQHDTILKPWWDGTADNKREGQVWEAVGTHKQLTPQQLAEFASELHHTLRQSWWEYPALAALYGSQGKLPQEQHWLSLAGEHAVLPMLLLTMVVGGGFFVVLLGLAACLYTLVHTILNAQRAVPKPSRWEAAPEPIELPERKLGWRLLLGVFALYMLLPSALGAVASGYRGIGPHHLFRFAGLLTGILPKTGTVSDGVVVAIAAGSYLFAAGIPLGLLYIVARKRGASLADELGFKAQPVFKNLVFGLCGYAAALVVMFVTIQIVTPFVKSAPSPANPVMPLIAASHSAPALIGLLLLTAVGAPLTEEPMFRGVLLQGLRQRLGIWPAILGSGFVFGFSHPVGIGGMVPLMVLGGMFAWMAHTRKSLLPSMLGHFLQNFSVSVMMMAAFMK